MSNIKPNRNNMPGQTFHRREEDAPKPPIFATVMGPPREPKSVAKIDPPGGRMLSSRGRPRKLDAALKAKVCAYVQMGMSCRQAAAQVAVNPSTITREAQRDSEFALEIKLSRQKGAVQPWLQVIKASQHSWRAAAWIIRQKELRREKSRESRVESQEGSKREERREKREE